MTKTIQINVGDATTTKGSEIATLRKLQHQFENSGTYLASLFTEQLVDWVESKIRDDFTPDVFLTLCNVQDQLDQADAQYSILERKANESNDSATEGWAKAASLKGELDECQRKAAKDLSEALAYANKEYVEMASNSNLLHGQLNDEFDKVRDLETLVTRLKAHIFDLEHPGMSYQVQS